MNHIVTLLNGKDAASSVASRFKGLVASLGLADVDSQLPSIY